MNINRRHRHRQFEIYINFMTPLQYHNKNKQEQKIHKKLYHGMKDALAIQCFIN